jgi:glycosyltransferase involved in cell wall biosynthesis
MMAPLIESVPPRKYGGTERVVSLLTEELVKAGHQVTLFASADSVTSAELVPCSPQSLRLSEGIRDYVAYTISQLAEVYGRAEEFDLIHNHVDYFAFPPARFASVPTLTTTHGRLDVPEVRTVYRAFRDLPLTAISEAQRASLPGVNWVSTVYNGVDLRNFHFRPDPGDYLVFLGRISPEKRPDRAISIARAVGIPLKIAAKVDRVDEVYFRTQIEPLFEGGGVEFIGEINDREKTQFLGDAQALLFPIDWPEPFGLSMIEAMACGTPVLAFRRGSVQEIVEDGVTGAIVETVKEAIAALPHVIALDRKKVRQRFEQRFSATRMAKDYVDIYRSLVKMPSPRERQEIELAPNGKRLNVLRPLVA